MPDPVDVHVGKQLRDRRIELGLTQQKFAKMLNMSFQQVQKYETGANRVSASRMWHICEIMHVQPGYFFDGLPARGSKIRKTSAATKTHGKGAADQPGQKEVLLLNQHFRNIQHSTVRRQLRHLVKSISDLG